MLALKYLREMKRRVYSILLIALFAVGIAPIAQVIKCQFDSDTHREDFFHVRRICDARPL
jgi:hypothetical protein